MRPIASNNKLSDKLAVILCDRSQRNPSQGICNQDAILLAIQDADRRRNSGLAIPDGIQAWLISRGTPDGYNDTDRYYLYPVGGVREVARKKYNEAERNGTMWAGEYGQERKELLRFLIRWFREKGL